MPSPRAFWVIAVLTTAGLASAQGVAPPASAKRMLSCSDRTYAFGLLLIDERADGHALQLLRYLGGGELKFFFPPDACKFHPGDPQVFDCRAKTPTKVKVDGKLRTAPALMIQMVRKAVTSVDGTLETLELFVSLGAGDEPKGPAMTIPADGCFLGEFPSNHPARWQ